MFSIPELSWLYNNPMFTPRELAGKWQTYRIKIEKTTRFIFEHLTHAWKIHSRWFYSQVKCTGSRHQMKTLSNTNLVNFVLTNSLESPYWIQLLGGGLHPQTTSFHSINNHWQLCIWGNILIVKWHLFVILTCAECQRMTRL